tara:strand:+ start:178 stop:378 length:201 start_codon:yes stop_codon:yes gene_type:complete
MWVDGRGGAREGAGRPKSNDVKRAFRITDEERNFIKKMRLLTDEGVQLLNKDLVKVSKKHSINNWW